MHLKSNQSNLLASILLASAQWQLPPCPLKSCACGFKQAYNVLRHIREKHNQEFQAAIKNGTGQRRGLIDLFSEYVSSLTVPESSPPQSGPITDYSQEFPSCFVAKK